MSETFEEIRRLVDEVEIKVSVHGYDEATDDRIPIREIVAGVAVEWWWWIVPTIRRVLVSLCYNGTVWETPFMLCGGFPRTRFHPQ